MIAEGTSERASERRRWRETGREREGERRGGPKKVETAAAAAADNPIASPDFCPLWLVPRMRTAWSYRYAASNSRLCYYCIYMFFPWDDLWACVLITMSRFTENDPRCSVPSLPPNMRITSDARATSGEERGAPYANDRRKEGRKEGASSFYEWVGWAGQGTLSSTRLAIPTSPEVAANWISELRSSFHSPLRNKRPNYVKI